MRERWGGKVGYGKSIWQGIVGKGCAVLKIPKSPGPGFSLTLTQIDAPDFDLFVLIQYRV